MRKNIHPKLYDVAVQCRCESQFNVRSTMAQTPLNVERCGSCLTMSNDTYNVSQDAGSARARLFENFSLSELES